MKDYFNKTFKPIIFIVCHINVSDYNTTLFFINTQAMYYLIKDKNQYMY